MAELLTIGWWLVISVRSFYLHHISSRSCICLALTGLFAVYPIFSLSTQGGHRAIPVLALLVSLAALSMRRAAWTSQLTLWTIALVLLTAPYYLSYIVHSSEAYTMERISYGWLFLVIGAVVARVEPDLKPLFFTLILGALTTLLAQLWSGGHRPALDFNPIPFAELAACFFCLLCVGLIYTRNIWQVMAVLLGLGLWVAVILLTQTRGAVLAMIPGLVFLLAYCVKRYSLRLSLLGVSALFVVATAAELVSDHAMSKRFQDAWNELQLYSEQPQIETSIAIRIELYRAALMVAKTNAMGLGSVGAREQVLEWVNEGRIQPYTRHSMEVAHFHSDWFQLLAIAGYFGVLCLFAFYTLLIWYFYCYRDQLPAQLGLVFVASFVISGLTDVPLHNRLTLWSLFMVVTFCLASVKGKTAIVAGRTSSV